MLIFITHQWDFVTVGAFICFMLLSFVIFFWAINPHIYILIFICVSGMSH